MPAAKLRIFIALELGRKQKGVVESRSHLFEFRFLNQDNEWRSLWWRY